MMRNGELEPETMEIDRIMKDRDGGYVDRERDCETNLQEERQLSSDDKERRYDVFLRY